MNMYNKLTYILFICLSFISAPVIFAEAIFFGRELRIFLASALIFFLFLTFKKFKIADITIFLFLLFLVIIEILILRSDINNIFSFYSVLIISFLLFRNLEKNKFNFDRFLNLWLKFSLILSIFAIISFVIHQFTSLNFDFFNFESFKKNYPYQISFFGFTIDKNFGFVTLARVCVFFNEPLNAGIFFGLNFLLAKVNRNFISKKYALFFLVAGLLTFSVTFYMIFLFLKLRDFKLKINFTQLLWLIAIFLMFLLIIIISLSQENSLKEFIPKNSFNDRLPREIFALKVILESQLLKFLFGHGIGNYSKLYPNEFGYMSTGYLSFLFEFGLIPFVIILVFILFFLKSRFDLIIVLSICLLTYPIYRSFIYWGIIILINLSFITNHNSTFNKLNSK